MRRLELHTENPSKNTHLQVRLYYEKGIGTAFPHPNKGSGTPFPRVPVPLHPWSWLKKYVMSSFFVVTSGVASPKI